MNDTLFFPPVKVGALTLRHRLAMAPMTRSRATAEGVPTQANAEYYAQRASTALIVSEGTQPSADGQGYLLTPGIYTDAHVAGWRLVTDAVHAAHGHIFIQLMHTGRVAHPDNTPHGRQPVAPSALAPDAKMFTAAGMKEIPEPRAMTTAEVTAAVGEFRHAAASAIRAGADGVEIHAANGYLIHQFLSSNANTRNDKYGGTIANRIRFAVEVATAVAEEIGADRTGIQISPGNPFNDIVEDDTEELYTALVDTIAPLGLAYLNLVHPGDEDLAGGLRKAWPGALLLNRGGASIDRRAQDVADGLADVVTVGRMVLANPDLVARLQAGAPLNDADPASFYGGDAHGYTDYPTLDPTQQGPTRGALNMTSEPGTIPADDPTRRATVIDPDSPDAQHIAVVGDTYTVLLRGADTGGRFAMIDMLVPDGSGPPAHRHDFDETFHVVDGEIDVTFRGETSTVKAGQTANIPSNAPHSFRNASGSAARLMCVVAPAGLEDFFAAVGDPVDTRTSPPPHLDDAQKKARMDKAVELAPAYRQQLLPPS